MNQTTEAITKMQVEANERIDELSVDAKSLIDTYWEGINKHQEKNDISTWSKLGCRVFIRQSTGGPSIRITWYINHFFKTVEGKKNKNAKQWGVRSVEIKANNKTGEYNLAQLKSHAPEWSHQLVEDTEQGLAEIRKQIQLLGKLRRSISRAKTEMEKMNRRGNF